MSRVVNPMATRRRRQRSTTQRGYGSDHQKTRARLLPDAYGQPCSRCGKPMLEGQALHLDHDDHDRTRYRGFSHASCNTRAGARKGNRKRARKTALIKAATAGRW